MENWLLFAGIRRANLAWSATVIVLASVGVFLAHPAAAASFDCAKAATAIEKMICADAKLSRTDGALGEAYAEARARAADPAALKSAQRAWLRDTRNACPDAACLRAAYRARIAELTTDFHPRPFPPLQQRVGFKLATGRDKKICQGVERGLREHELIPARWQLCGVPFPSDDPGFERLAPWRDMDPAEHMDLVQEIFYWFNIRLAVLGDRNLHRQMVSREILQDLMNLIWEPSQTYIEALVDAGRLTLQVNRFDYDNDGEDETVYRMTGVISGVRYKDGEYVSGPPFLITKSCREAVPGWPDVPYIYVLEKHGMRYTLPTRTFPRVNFSFFLYEGRTYWMRDGWTGDIERAIPIRPAPAGPARGSPVCDFSVY